jgi:transposase
MTTPEPLPADLAEAHAMIIALRAARYAAEAEAAIAKQTKRVLDLEIERLKLEIARLRRQRFGTSSERSARLEQLELALTELQETVAEADAASELRAAEQTPPPVRSTATPRKPARRPLPESLPRTRVVYPAPAACPCCGGTVRKLGEEITETLERLPARWLVVSHVREKVSCRCCEAIREAPAPFHPIARGRAGPNLLAEVIFGKYGMHLPLNRQSACFAREGIELDVSTLADWVGAVAASLRPCNR